MPSRFAHQGFKTCCFTKLYGDNCRPARSILEIAITFSPDQFRSSKDFREGAGANMSTVFVCCAHLILHIGKQQMCGLWTYKFLKFPKYRHNAEKMRSNGSQILSTFARWHRIVWKSTKFIRWKRVNKKIERQQKSWRVLRTNGSSENLCSHKKWPIVTLAKITVTV